MKKDWSGQSYGLTLSYEINGDEMRHTNWGSMTRADLGSIQCTSLPKVDRVCLYYMMS